MNENFDMDMEIKLSKVRQKISDLKEKEKELEKEKKERAKARKEKLICDIGKQFFKMGFTSLELIEKHKDEIENILKSKNEIKHHQQNNKNIPSQKTTHSIIDN